MANIRILAALERAKTDLMMAHAHVKDYVGVDKNKAMKIDDLTTEIADMASDIAGLARQVMGNRSGERLNHDVRKVLGFTRP